MSTKEIADRELDALVAERVMDIRQIFKPCEYDSANQALYGVNTPSWIPSGKSPRTHMIDARPVPHYSTDIASAMLVVEKMRERGFSVEFKAASRLVEEREQVWAVTINQHGYRTGRFFAHNQSLPRAICECALESVKEKET